MSYTLAGAVDTAAPTLSIGRRSILSSGWRRSLAALAPAAMITAGLFYIMDGLISVEDVTLDPSPQRILESIVYSHHDPHTAIFVRPRPEMIDVQTPPPPPQRSPIDTDVGLPPITHVGGVPSRTPIANVSTLMTDASPIIDRVATPVRQPLPVYPSAMASRGQEGECLVRFSLTARGVPFNVVADCSHRGFESEARRSVEKAEFLPGILKGQPAESHGFSYPLQFRLSEE